MLREFLGAKAACGERTVEHQRPARRRSLIDGKDMAHARRPAENAAFSGLGAQLHRGKP